ncbi:hypothetical protein GCK72_013362 [Caenorhabditis remanei]|nr:hypothetical protein GCK72_013362 [Caenorhabditis remanei]KAF1756908.1 hypothetical protein GCK72_013362 [Caenorhabditis remanei]
MYGCRCLQKDQTKQLLTSLTNGIPVNANRPIWKSFVREQPTLSNNLQSKIQYLKEWLATLTLDTPTVPPTTTTTTTSRPQTTEDPVALPFDEAAVGNNVFLKLAYKMMAKYFKKFRGEWTILDRFECICDGDLIELLKSKTFINIQVAHD